MGTASDRQGMMIRYLLGDLPEEDRWALASEYISDEGAYEELCAVEDELIDKYLRGELDERTRPRFERHYLASERRRAKVEFARAFMKMRQPAGSMNTCPDEVPLKAADHPPIKPVIWTASSGYRFLALAAVVALAAACLWLFSHTTHERRNNSGLRAGESFPAATNHRTEEGSPNFVAENSNGPKSSRPEMPETPSRTRAESGLITFLLIPGATRSAGGQKPLVLPSSADAVRLKITVPAGVRPQKYQVEVRTVAGEVVWSSTEILSEKRGASTLVSARVPAEVFTHRDYTVSLRGFDSNGQSFSIGDYYLRVARD